MSSKDEKNLTQVIEKIASMKEPERSLMQRVHELIMDAAALTETADLAAEKRITEIVRSAV